MLHIIEHETVFFVSEICKKEKKQVEWALITNANLLHKKYFSKMTRN